MASSLFLIFGTAFAVSFVLGHAIVELLLVMALAWGLSKILGQSLVAGLVEPWSPWRPAPSRRGTPGGYF